MNQSARKKNGNGFALIGILLAVIVIGIVGTVVGYSLGQKKKEQPAKPSVAPSKQTPPESLVTQPPKEEKKPPSSHAAVYVKDSNIFLYSLNDKTETQITTDGSQLISYQRPLWLDEETFAFSKCVRTSSDGKTPYTCGLYIQKVGGTATELFKQTSQPNVNGYQTGAEISLFSFTHDQAKVAYWVTSYEKNKDFGQSQLKIFDIKSKNSEMVDSIDNHGGRGGGLDDSAALDFSPDDTHLLVVNTGLYPMQDKANDHGTLMVYDVSSKKRVWEQAGSWTTFGHWLDNTTILAKQYPAAGHGASQKLVKIDVGKNSADAVMEANGWYNLEPVGKDKAVFWKLNPKQGSGLLLYQIDLKTQETKELQSNVVNSKVLSDGTLLVRTLQPCSQKGEDVCGMDVYNGYTEEGLGIVDVASGQLNSLTIGTSKTAVFDADLF